jgi:hypothetical protein
LLLQVRSVALPPQLYYLKYDACCFDVDLLQKVLVPFHTVKLGEYTSERAERCCASSDPYCFELRLKITDASPKDPISTNYQSSTDDLLETLRHLKGASQCQMLLC